METSNAQLPWVQEIPFTDNVSFLPILIQPLKKTLETKLF